MFPSSDRRWSVLQKKKRRSASKTKKLLACIPWLHIWTWSTTQSFSAVRTKVINVCIHVTSHSIYHTYSWPMNSEHWTIRCCSGIPLSNLFLHKNIIIFNISKTYTIIFYVYLCWAPTPRVSWMRLRAGKGWPGGLSLYSDHISILQIQQLSMSLWAKNC